MATDANAGSKKMILAVDDSAETLGMINQVLTKAGYSVLIALDGVQALGICSQLTPDLILMDAKMPNMDGFETTRRLRMDPHLTDIPVIFMTGLEVGDGMAPSFDAGANDYIKKPVDIGELLIRIESRIRSGRSQAAVKESMDNAGSPSVAVTSGGRMAWATPMALDLLSKSGLDRASISVLLPAELLKAASRGGGEFLIQGTKPPVYAALEERNSMGDMVFRVSAMDPAAGAAALRAKLGLTSREAEVLYWMSQGKSNKDLALILGISPRTVTKFTELIFQKLGVDNRTSAANIALKAIG